MSPTFNLINITFVDAAGESPSGDVQVPVGTTVCDFVRSKIRSYSPERHNVRLYRGDSTYGKKKCPLDMNMTLQDGDRVQVSPGKPAMA